MNDKKFTDKEFIRMFQLIKKFSETEMDQFDHRKFNSKYGKVYVSVLRQIPESEEGVYLNISNLLET